MKLQNQFRLFGTETGGTFVLRGQEKNRTAHITNFLVGFERVSAIISPNWFVMLPSKPVTHGFTISTRIFLYLALLGLSSSLQAQIAGRNVNMVSGTQWPGGDPFLQRQNEPTLAISTRNPMHMIAGANDYRTVDLPGLTAGETGDAWLGVFKSFDGGQTWTSTLLPGYPQDTSTVGTATPMKGFQAAADPVVRAGTNGFFYYAGLVFNRGANGASSVVVSRFLDNNNNEAGDPIQFLGASSVASGLPPSFLDKPWLAVDIPRAGATTCYVGSPIQPVLAGNVYVAYTAFAGGQTQGAIMFARSSDCGVTWSTPISITPGTATNQGATMAIDPRTGNLYIAWRRFASASAIDAIMFSMSTDGGQTFSAPSVATLIDAFDQSTSAVSFRTNSYPTLAVDGNGLIYLAWSQRGVGPGGDARIVVSTSSTGTIWAAPVPVDNPPVRGHQFMPSLSFASGLLGLVYYDMREDNTTGMFTPLGGGQYTETRVAVGDLAAPADPAKVFTTGIVDASPSPDLGALEIRHTMEVRVAEAKPGVAPVFSSVRVSQYPIGSRPGNTGIEQMQTNPPNLPMFAMGTVPFIGDYVDIAALAFVQDGSGNWIYNTAASNSSVFQAVWTDNRDVRPPADLNWTQYTPPTSASTQPTSIFDPTQPQPSCQLGYSGSRNQNIYTATISQGLVATSPGNSKQLNSQFPRAFVISVQNTTPLIKTFRLVVANQPAGGRASFAQRSSSSSAVKLDVTVPPRSTIARTVFVISPLAQAQVRVDVVEVTAPNGTVVAGGLQSSVLLNPDPTNPANPGIAAAEVYNPDISNPDISNPDISNPDISNPDISNPSQANVVVENPDISNPDISNPDISNPDISNPDISNPTIPNPDISNAAFTDVTWTLTNAGNTYSSYTIRTVLANNFPQGFIEQLAIYRVYQTPVSSNCSLLLQTTTDLLTNIVAPVFVSPSTVANPDISNSAVNDATVALAPNETAAVTLRVVNPNKTTNTNFDPSTAVILAATSHAVNTTDLAAGSNQPPVAASRLLVVTNTVPSGQVGAVYAPPALLSAGGAGPVKWSLFAGALPSGLNISAAGVIFGTPTASGTFPITVQAADSSQPQQITTQALTIVIAPVRPLAMVTTSVPKGYVGVNYSYPLVASGGLPPLTWSVSAGATPPGMALSSTGVLSGVPQLLGTTTFTVTVNDSSLVPLTSSRQFSLQVVPLTLVFASQPVNTPSGQTMPVQVKLEDSFGNGIAGVPLALTIGSGGAKVYDVVQDYSNTSNPNGPWTYGEVSNSAGAGFIPFGVNLPATTCTNPPGGQCWTDNLGFPSNASIIQNTTPQTILYSGTILQPTNVLNLQVENSFPNVRWTAPTTDNYTIRGQFSRIDTVPNPTNVEVLQNGSTVLFSANNFSDTFNPQQFNLTNVSLTAGATLDFFAGAAVSPLDDSTGLQVTITGSGAILNGATTAVTAANGVATFNVSISTTGAYTLKVAVPVAQAIFSNTFTIF